MKTYYVTVYYERESQNTAGVTSLNMKLPDNWDIDYIKHELANDFFCCNLAVKEVKEVPIRKSGLRQKAGK